jgi:hypothetical protein
MSSFVLRPSDDVAKVECLAALPRDGTSLRVHSMPRRLAAGSFTFRSIDDVERLAFTSNFVCYEINLSTHRDWTVSIKRYLSFCPVI